MDLQKDQNYEENEGATRSTEVNLRKLEQRWMKEQKDRREPHGTTASMVIKQCMFFYAFYSLRKNKNTLKAYTDVSKSIGFFAAVFMQTISLKKPPFTVKITAIKIALMEIHKREDKRWVIYTQFYKSM